MRARAPMPMRTMTVCRNAAELRFMGGVFTFAMVFRLIGDYRLSIYIYRFLIAAMKHNQSPMPIMNVVHQPRLLLSLSNWQNPVTRRGDVVHELTDG